MAHVEHQTSYDLVRYANQPYAQTHPERLAVLAKLWGLEPAPVDRCRVLELGASEGANLIPMALGLRGSEFVGVELAGEPVARGRAVVEELGLKNIRLLQMDLMDISARLGRFDCVIAHGLYAWAPPPVQDKILEIAQVNLNPQGVAFVSYNTYPGGRLREIVREMMLYHAESETDPARRIERARSILALAAQASPDPDAFDMALQAEAQAALEREDSSLFHDYMSECWAPVYLHQFVEHASRHMLQYLCDASIRDTTLVKLSAEALKTAHEFAGGDRVAEEQYLDLLRLRRFRQSVLCHQGVPLAPAWQTGVAAGMHVASPAREAPGDASGEVKFVLAGSGSAATNHPGVIAMLRRLAALWPRSEPVAGSDAGLVLELYRRGLVQLRTGPFPTAPPGERPRTSSLARLQAARGESITTLLHGTIEVDGALARKLITLLDGSRGRDALAAELAVSREQLDPHLEELGRLGLLTG